MLCAWHYDRAVSPPFIVSKVTALKRTVAGALTPLGNALSDVCELLPETGEPCCGAVARALFGNSTVPQAVLISRSSFADLSNLVTNLLNTIQVLHERPSEKPSCVCGILFAQPPWP